MYQQTYQGINSCLVDLCQQLKEHGVPRNTRGFDCIELPEPILIKIENPTARWVTLPERYWNPILPYAESLWIATGSNDLQFITHYLKKMANFSDDQRIMRAAYGARLRFFDGEPSDYLYTAHNYNKHYTSDQFAYLEQLLKEEPNSRRGTLTIANPIKDHFYFDNQKIKKTLDYPCTCTLHFYLNTNGALDLIVHMRSNDLIWGLSAVNVFNFTFMQEYFAAILGVPLGAYYHSVNNLHYYEDQQDKIEALASYQWTKLDNHPFEYQKSFASLKEFDTATQQLLQAEKQFRSLAGKEKIKDNRYNFEQKDSFFKDWARVLYMQNTHKYIPCENSILDQLMQYRFCA